MISEHVIYKKSEIDYNNYPIGSIVFSASQNVGDDWLKCDGSFISETEHPELVTTLGKLTPSADKFQLVSDNEIPSDISNGVLYDGRMWVYSYSVQKLYGVDLNGTNPIKEISLSSTNTNFQNFIAPNTARPLVLSIVPHTVGTGAMIFLTQIIEDVRKGGTVDFTDLQTCFLIFGGEFSTTVSNLTLEMPFTKITKYGNSYRSTTIHAGIALPQIVSQTVNGAEQYSCMIGCGTYSTTTGSTTTVTYVPAHIVWSQGDLAATQCHDENNNTTYSNPDTFDYQRISYSKKNKNEAISTESRLFGKDSSGLWASEYSILSKNTGVFNRPYTSINADSYFVHRSSYGPINIGGEDYVLFSFDKDVITYASIKTVKGGCAQISTLPDGARVFVDAAAYLWGKDVYMIFVGTGILFSRNMETWGYLDTTSVLGHITQFGYLDYSEDEGTLYLLGQDSDNHVKIAKMELNTLFNYSNDGAWLPMIASDGVPAWIKADVVGESE